MKSIRFVLSIILLVIGVINTLACSRVVYLGENNNIILIARTLDWKNPIPTNLYVYPQGVAKTSMPTGYRFEWTSKYASVVAVGYDGGVTEGMNECGLVMNGLFCRGSVYKTPIEGSDIPIMSLSMFVSYFLDNFATIDEVDSWLKETPFAINAHSFDGGTSTVLHWALTDLTGETLVLEYDGGELKTYRGRELTVLTNAPQLPSMQAIEDYWIKKGGTHTLPGTVSSPDRFVRASFYIKNVVKNLKYAEAYGAISSVIGTVTVPYSYSIVGEPNLSSTQWTSIADATGGKYFFRFADQTGAMWVDLNSLNLSLGASILKLDTGDHAVLRGNVNNLLKHSLGFTPMW